MNHDQQPSPGVVRTADEVHAANNAVIAAAKAAAKEHGLTMVIVVGAAIDGGRTSMIGVDVSPSDWHGLLQLVAMAYGAVQTAAQGTGIALAKHAEAAGRKNAAMLFDRGAAHCGYKVAERCCAILATILDMVAEADAEYAQPIDNESLAYHLELPYENKDQLAMDLQALLDAGILTREGGFYELRAGFQDDMVAAGIRALVEKALGVR